MDSYVQASGFKGGETNTERIHPYGQQLESTHVYGKGNKGGSDQTSPRLNVLKTRQRSQSPRADFRGGNKRLVPRRCELFSKGWCIKGNNCRFLHSREHATSHDKDRGRLPNTSKIQHEKGLEERSVVDGSSNSSQNLCLRPNRSSSQFGSTSTSSAFPSSKTGQSWINDLSQETQHSSDYKTNASSDDWEPSVPFRSSVLLSQMIRFPESSLRNPSRYSDGGDGSSSVLTKHNADPASMGPEQSSNKVPISGEKDLPSNDTAVAHQENIKTSLKEDEHSRSANPKKMHLESERLTHEKEIDIDHTSMNTESRAFKRFHAALVDFVKEILRPTWEQGLLSKDAYKMIIKKTVEKVENSFQPNQIPDTAESTRNYLEVNLTKISNLIGAYVRKYVFS